MKKFKLASAICALIISHQCQAGLISEVVISDTECQTSSVQITGITAVYPAGENIVPENTAIDSTSCLGFISYPDNDWGNNPDPNKGGLEDGLLNGELVEKGQGKDKDSYYVPGDYFLTNENDSMVNLDGLGEADDPGWIRLGGAETVSDGKWDFQYDSIGNYDLGSVITMSFYQNGTWELAVDPAAISLATAALGRPSIFDHLAFVLKGPNNLDDSWAIFDFNFHDLIDDGWDISLGDTAYKFDGKWDTNLFTNNDALSHMSVWAHDPPATTDVPEPSTLGILGLSLLALRLRKLKS